MPVSPFSSNLLDTAQIYLALGYSVIPVWGAADPQRPKVAAVEWKPFQRRKPTLSQLQQWFIEEQHLGLAILTGNISLLIVLDFDSHDLFKRFIARYPTLAETRTVQTRRGWHLYFGYPPHLGLASRQVPGADLLANGRYVIAPPTVIDDFEYRVARGGLPKTLTAFDIQRIETFLDELTPKVVPPVIAETILKSETPSVAPADLLALYRHLAPQEGRNTALFHTSLRARDAGWTQEQVSNLLVNTHVHQVGPGSHRRETDAQRQREALSTIRSAFSRSARPRRAPAPYNNSQLPTSCREQFMHMKQTYMVRVIEGLRLKGILPSKTFTRNQAVKLLQDHVGRDSVDHALNATVPDGQGIFAQKPPSGHPHAANAAAEEHRLTPTTHCAVVREKESGISPAHRPARVFVMPGNLEVCQKLGVRPSVSDPLTLDELGSAKTTRHACHRELIRRRPGHYSRCWLAERLGVSIRTLAAYNHALPIRSRPSYWSQLITWLNLDDIPQDLDIAGTFLEDADTGKRYPPKREIAVGLLGKKRLVLYKRQYVNYYWYEDEPAAPMPPVPIRPEWQRLGVEVQLAPQEITLRQPAPPINLIPSAPNSALSPSETGKTSPPKKAPRRSKRFYRRPLEDAVLEGLAQRACQVIAQKTEDRAKHLSQANARRLVDKYGAALVEKMLRLVERRTNLAHPAGFLWVVLRSEAKAVTHRL